MQVASIRPQAMKSQACENIRFSSLFVAGDVSREERGETDVFAGYEITQEFRSLHLAFARKQENHLLPSVASKCGHETKKTCSNRVPEMTCFAAKHVYFEV